MFDVTDELKLREKNRWKQVNDLVNNVESLFIKANSPENSMSEYNMSEYNENYYFWLMHKLVKYNIKRSKIFKHLPKTHTTQDNFIKFYNYMDELEDTLIKYINENPLLHTMKIKLLLVSLERYALFKINYYKDFMLWDDIQNIKNKKNNYIQNFYKEKENNQKIIVKKTGGPSIHSPSIHSPSIPAKLSKSEKKQLKKIRRIEKFNKNLEKVEEKVNREINFQKNDIIVENDTDMPLNLLSQLENSELEHNMC